MIRQLQRLLAIVAGALLCERLLPPASRDLPPPAPPLPPPAALMPPPPGTTTTTAAASPSVEPLSHEPDDTPWRIVERARLEVERGVRYDASYRKIPYPGGDVPPDVGACTDLVVRAVRAAGIDLQVLVHEDAIAFPEHYPAAVVGDASIDHRRIATLFAYFEHNADALEADPFKPVFRAGDLVFYSEKPCSPRVPCMARHVALVSDRIGRRGLPLVLQNGGPRAVESDALDQPTMVGHFRVTKAMRAHSLSNELVFWSALPNVGEDAPSALAARIAPH